MIWYQHRGLQDEDIFLSSYPRSGNTWLRFLLFNLLKGEDADFPSVNRDIPDIGRQNRAPPLVAGISRLIKTHEPHRTEYKKAVYLCRDPRDVVISEYHFQIWLGIYRQPFDHFFRDFMRGKVNGYGSWTEHINSWMNALHAGRCEVLMIKFEDLRSDSPATLTRILNFLGVAHSPQSIAAAITANSVERMRKKEEQAGDSVFKNVRPDKRFIRRGSTSDWPAHLAPHQADQILDLCGPVMKILGYSVEFPD